MNPVGKVIGTLTTALGVAISGVNPDVVSAGEPPSGRTVGEVAARTRGTSGDSFSKQSEKKLEIPSDIQLASFDDLQTSVQDGKIKNADLIHPSFSDPKYKNTVDDILKRLPDASARGLQGVDIGRLFTVDAFVSDAIVRGAKAGYLTGTLLGSHDVLNILASKDLKGISQIEDDGVRAKRARDFIDNQVVGRYVIPRMIEQHYPTVIKTRPDVKKDDPRLENIAWAEFARKEGARSYKDLFDEIIPPDMLVATK